MKSNRIYIVFLLHVLCFSAVYAQSEGFSYQVILETKGEYNNLDKGSEVNPDNAMNISDFTALSQLYPILKFKTASDKIGTELGVEMNLKNYDFEKDSTKLLFQELYSQFTIRDKHYIVFGKKRLDWGSGMIWNPTNFFVQKDPLRTQNRLEGIFMLNYSYLFGQNSVSVYVFPDKKAKNTKAAIKFDYTKDKVDGSLSFVEYGDRQQFGFDLTYGGTIYTLYAEGVLRNYTKSYKVDKDGRLITPEDSQRSFKAEVVAGGSVVFNSNISVRGEYRFREDYLSKNEIGTYIDYLPANMLIWDPISIGKHTLFGSFELSDTYGRWSCNLRSFYDPLSKQLIVSPLGVLSMNNFQVEVSTMFFNNELSIHNFQSSVVLSCFF